MGMDPVSSLNLNERDDAPPKERVSSISYQNGMTQQNENGVGEAHQEKAHTYADAVRKNL